MDSGYGDEFQPREHRAGAWMLLVIGIAALGLGIFQFRNSIFSPFDLESDYRTEEELEQERLAALKGKDTDLDGVTDFDEQYVFGTSPYLDDSDSDGIDDKTELEQGTNPNCPEGKECGPLGEEFFAAEDAFRLDPVIPEPQEDLELIETMLNPTPDQIRQLLLDSGVPKADIDAFDDEALTSLYQESLREVQAQDLSTAP